MRDIAIRVENLGKWYRIDFELPISDFEFLYG